MLLLALWMTGQTLVAAGLTAGAGSMLRAFPHISAQAAAQLEAQAVALRMYAKGMELALLIEDKPDYIKEFGETIDRIEYLKMYELKHFRDDADVSEQQEVARGIEYFIELIGREPDRAELDTMVTELEAELEAELERIRNS